MADLFVSDIRMGESPRWHDGRFWMCDWLAGEVLVFDASGERHVVARVDGLPFSIDWLPDGRMLSTTPTGVVVGTELTPYGAAGQPFNEIVVDVPEDHFASFAKARYKAVLASAPSETFEVVLRKPYWSGGRTVSAIFTAMTRADFQVDVIAEPAPIAAKDAFVPGALIVRARKLGV